VGGSQPDVLHAISMFSHARQQARASAVLLNCSLVGPAFVLQRPLFEDSLRRAEFVAADDNTRIGLRRPGARSASRRWTVWQPRPHTHTGSSEEAENIRKFTASQRMAVKNLLESVGVSAQPFMNEEKVARIFGREDDLATFSMSHQALADNPDRLVGQLSQQRRDRIPHRVPVHSKPAGDRLHRGVVALDAPIAHHVARLVNLACASGERVVLAEPAPGAGRLVAPVAALPPPQQHRRPEHGNVMQLPDPPVPSPCDHAIVRQPDSAGAVSTVSRNPAGSLRVCSCQATSITCTPGRLNKVSTRRSSHQAQRNTT